LAKGLGGADFILSGCKITYAGSNASVTAGYIVLNGEVFRVDAATVVVGGDPAKYVIREIADVATDPVTYADGADRDVHMIRTAVIMGESVVPGGAYSKYESEVLVNYGSNVGDVLTYSNSWGNGSLPLPNANYKKYGKTVKLAGDIAFSGSVPATNLPFMTLPFAFRPSANTIQTVMSAEGISNEYLIDPIATWIRIKTTGECFCDPNMAIGARKIVLDGVSFDVI
jgi:hypothetical protein